MEPASSPLVDAEDGRFDDIARLATQLCATPMALVSVLETGLQVPKASIGIEATTAPLDGVICRHTVAERGLLVIPDLAADDRTRTHPLVTAKPSLRFYAGVLLTSADGSPLGTLCVIDDRPRPEGLTEEQAKSLEALGRQVIAQLELLRERARFEAVFDSAVDYAIVVMNLDGTIVDWNEGAVRILGWTREEICGRDLQRRRTAPPASPTRRWRAPGPPAAASTNAGTCARAASVSGRAAR